MDEMLIVLKSDLITLFAEARNKQYEDHLYIVESIEFRVGLVFSERAVHPVDIPTEQVLWEVSHRASLSSYICVQEGARTSYYGEISIVLGYIDD